MVNELSSRFENSEYFIIQTLCQEYPLSIKGVYIRITTRNRRTISYQAIHKMFKKLLKKGIIEPEGKFFKLNLKWLEARKQFFDFVYNAYSCNQGRLEFPA